jgi:tRNA-specific 2-thiouridylase
MSTALQTTPNQNVALGLSGGVDSAVCAHLLKQQGHNVTTVYIECWNEPGCRAEQDKQDALKIALALELPFKTLDFRQQYKDQVLDYFLTEYQAGRTPNPDVLCNQVIKFGLFYDWALSQGFDYIATGHYAQIMASSNINSNPKIALNGDAALQLASSIDEHKDQTYFLNLLTSDKLQRILFPIGHLQKKAVRELATQLQLPVADKKDSTGICFVGEINVSQFLKDSLGEQLGAITDQSGNRVGTHRGLWFYTIGQRHGFTIDPKIFSKHNPDLSPDKRQLPPLYIVAKIPAENRLIVGTDWQRSQLSFNTQTPHWIDPQLVKTLLANQSARLLVRIRHTGELLPDTIKTQADKTLTITLSVPAVGVASGQSAVFYWQPNPKNPIKICLGGAVICC